ncbi:MAG: hypothetical protein CUN55_18495, partial [Phototrophicales bacterium]
MKMGHDLKPADVIFLLGNNDIRTAEYAARLLDENWAPWLAISGDGRDHESGLLKDKYNGVTEAEKLRDVAVSAGADPAHIVIECQANNTQENFENMKVVLDERGIQLKRAILVQKPYMERRTYATGRVRWPDVELILTSPPIPSEQYCNHLLTEEIVIN